MFHTRHSVSALAAATATTTFLLLGSAPAARAQQVTDPAGDFLSLYGGPRNGDLDVLSTDVLFSGSDFLFSATLNGAIGLTPDAFYVFGIDRGAGTARFGALAPGVLFDLVVVIRPGGESNVNDLVPVVTSSVLPTSNIVIDGNRLTARVPLGLLPSEGLAPEQYTFNLWPRLASTVIVGNAQISDFAPDNRNALVTTVPEPSSLAFVAGPAALALVGVVRRRRRAAQS